jgi:hypothetical protein
MNLVPTLKPDRQRRLSRPILAAAVASVILGATLAACAGASSAQTLTAKATTALPMGAGPWPSGPGWAASAQGPWAPARSARTEYFQVASTAPSGPGTIIITGVADAGGTEHPGQAIDDATFAGGGFRIDHSAGHPSARFSTSPPETPQAAPRS